MPRPGRRRCTSTTTSSRGAEPAGSRRGASRRPACSKSTHDWSDRPSTARPPTARRPAARRHTAPSRMFATRPPATPGADMQNRRTFLKATAAAALAGPAIVTSKSASAQAVTLRVGNWLPAHHLIVSGIVRPWAQAVEADSEGTVKFDFMSASIGRPPEYYDFCANGAIDVGFGVLGHNPNRFLMTEVMGMPFMSIDPWAGSAASWLAFTKYGARYNEHKGVQLVGTWVHSEPYLHMRAEGLKTIDDPKGKKIRVGSAITGRIVQALGRTPVQLPPTEAQQAMMSGVAAGITFPIESIEFCKITRA